MDATSCHAYHSKKAIPFSQALRLNRICSENEFFDKRCNQLEAWLIQRGYSAKLVRKQVIKARRYKRSQLLDKKEKEQEPTKLVLNITYHPTFARLKNLLNYIHLLLTPDKEHQKFFQMFQLLDLRGAKA